MPDTIRVLIVEDDKFTRDALNTLLNTEQGIEVIGVAENGEKGLQMALQLLPDVVLADINMPKMDGIEATRRLKNQLPHTRVVILTIYHDDKNVFEAIKAGAIGYLLKDSPLDEVGNAVRAAAHGESMLHPSIAMRVISEFQRYQTQTANMADLLSTLTDREMEVLRLVASGKRNKEIADELFLSEKTVKNHLSNILYKLQVNTRTEAALLAVQQGLV
jgi:DNA-binding NarL/FixJ family response regulator